MARKQTKAAGEDEPREGDRCVYVSVRWLGCDPE